MHYRRATPMTDTLPEWLESWLDENSIHPFAGSSFRAVSTYDLRAFLAQFVLCDAEPVAWLCKSADGLVDATASEFVRDDYARFKRDITPLYKAAGGGEDVNTPARSQQPQKPQ